MANPNVILDEIFANKNSISYTHKLGIFGDVEIVVEKMSDTEICVSIPQLNIVHYLDRFTTTKVLGKVLAWMAL